MSARTQAHESPPVKIADLTRKLAARPDDAALLLRRAELRRIEGDFTGAREDLAAIERLDPGRAELPLEKAALALEEEQPGAARGILDPLLREHPRDAGALGLRSRALVALGESRAALADVGGLISLLAEPPPDLFLRRAELQVGLGELDDARAGLDEARRRLGTGIPALEMFAVELELQANRPSEARERFEALRAHYANPQVLDGLDSRIEAAGGARTSRLLTAEAVADPSGEPTAGTPSFAVADALGVGATSQPTGTAAIQVVVSRGPYLQVGTPNAVTIRWRSDTASDSWVRYGTSPGSLTSSKSSSTLTTEHEVRITGLSPSTRYYYSVGASAGPLAGDATFTFRTAPPDGSPANVRLWVIGDSGEATSTARAVRDGYLNWTGTRGTDLWLMLGDNAYDTGTDAEYQAAVFNQYPSLLRQSVLWPTRGNHDEIHSGSNNDYYDNFTMPKAAEAGGVPSGSEAYYSFNWGDIHFICLDSEGSSRSIGGAMLTWLAADLAANTKKWTIAYWHHPPYTKGSHDSDDSADSGGRMRDMRQNALPILEAGGVDLVLSGHSHSYERSYLLDGHYGTSSSLQSSMILDNGDGDPSGDGEYLKNGAPPKAHEGAVYGVVGSSSHASGGSLNHPVMVTSQNVTGSLVLDITGNELDGRFLNGSGSVRDHFRIVKTESLDAPPPPDAAGDLRLGPGLPNPFTKELHIGWTLPRAAHVRLEVLDLAGRRVSTLANGWREAGPHESRWDGRDSNGGALAGGVYLAVLEVDGRRVSRKISFVP